LSARGELPREVAAGLDDLECRVHPSDCSSDIGARRIRRQVPIENDAQFVLEAGLDRCVAAEDVPRFDQAFLQQTGEDRLVDTELLLNGWRGQSNFPADAAGPLAAAATDQPQQQAISIVYAQPAEPGSRKIFSPPLRCFELLRGCCNFALVHRLHLIRARRAVPSPLRIGVSKAQVEGFCDFA
jgi:hypothetical protein